MNNYIMSASFVLLMTVALTAVGATAKDPVRVGVIAPASAINGRAIFQGAEVAASQINAEGGIDGRPIKLYEYDDHASAAQGVRAFQRAVRQDHVVAVIGNFISEVALAVMPWAARYQVPYINTGSGTTQMSQRVHSDYSRFKYVFRVMLNSVFLAKNVCAASKDILAGQLRYKTAVIMSEDASWTKPLDAEYEKCLPRAGLEVLDEIRFSPDTTDFSPIFHRVTRANPDVIIGGIAHVGVKPTVQWHQYQVPALLAGWSSQAQSTRFWDDTNGATQGALTGNLGASDAALTNKTVPFAKAYTKRFDESPAYDAFTTYDALFILKNGIRRAGTLEADALVDSLEKTDYVGTIGREQFYSKNSPYAHDLRYGEDHVTGVALQWQNGKQVVVWPRYAATGEVLVPSFIKNQ